MRLFVAAAILTGLAAGPACAQTAIGGPAAADLVPGEPPALNSTSRSYDLRNLYVPEGKGRWFVVETVTTRKDLLVESDEGVAPAQIAVSLREILDGKELGPEITKVAVDANAVKVERMPLLEVENWGCCVQANTLRSFDLLTGKLVSVRSSDLTLPTFTRTGSPAVGWRIEVFRGLDPLAEEILGKDQTVFGLVTLIREDQPVQQVLLRFKKPGDGDASTPVDWMNEMGWAAKGKGALTDHFVLNPGEASTMSFVWTIDEKTRIAIPFTGERLDVEHAALPATIAAADRKVE